MRESSPLLALPECRETEPDGAQARKVRAFTCRSAVHGIFAPKRPYADDSFAGVRSVRHFHVDPGMLQQVIFGEGLSQELFALNQRERGAQFLQGHPEN